MTLYEIDGAIREVIENGISFDPETGEVLFEDGDLDQLQIDLEKKIENIGLFVKNLRAEGWMIVTEKSRIKGAHWAVYRLIDDKKMTEEERQNAIYR